MYPVAPPTNQIVDSAALDQSRASMLWPVLPHASRASAHIIARWSWLWWWIWTPRWNKGDNVKWKDAVKIKQTSVNVQFFNCLSWKQNMKDFEEGVGGGELYTAKGTSDPKIECDLDWVSPSKDLTNIYEKQKLLEPVVNCCIVNWCPNLTHTFVFSTFSSSQK